MLAHHKLCSSEYQAERINMTTAYLQRHDVIIITPSTLWSSESDSPGRRAPRQRQHPMATKVRPVLFYYCCACSSNFILLSTKAVTSPDMLRHSWTIATKALWTEQFCYLAMERNIIDRLASSTFASTLTFAMDNGNHAQLWVIVT